MKLNYICLMYTFTIFFIVDADSKNVTTLTTPALETTSVLFTTEVNETEFTCNSSDTTCIDYVTMDITTSTTNDVLNVSTTNETPIVVTYPTVKSKSYGVSVTSPCSCNLQVTILVSLGLVCTFFIL